MSSRKVRVRFETRTIGPKGNPAFVYVASVLHHASVHYTALIEWRDGEEPRAYEAEVKRHWPDAVILSAELSVTSFQNIDLEMSRTIYGTYEREPEPAPGALRRWWRTMFGEPRRTITRTQARGLPSAPERNN